MPDMLDLTADVRTLTATIVDVESVSGGERALADAIEQALTDLPHLTVYRDGDAVVARTDLGREQRVVIAGHIDTVPIVGNVPSHVEGERLYGCGTSDMKSGVAVQLKLAAAVPEPVHDVTYVFYDCEEIEADRNGLRRLAAQHPEWLEGDFAVLMEPTGGFIEGGCQGTMRIEVSARGKRAHSARSWMGHNAIHEAGRVIDILREYAPRRPEVEGLRFHEGLNAVFVSGGVAGNVIPDECVVTINYRFAPDLSAQDAEQHLRELFAGYDVRVTDVAPPARPGLDHPAAAAFVRTVGDGQARAKLGWTDVARMSELGIPAVNYGPGEPTLAHTKDEFVELDAIVDAEKRMVGWLTGADATASAATDTIGDVDKG
ncbi:succinyl-diaminopimelate desuccinylase [Nocardiopsis rhodophaea]|uniref:Succinyl-diaminopimelate desuccinylase n=2 Tax=Nocardiopsis rhodophaea TaxID=280238 RepID=A0ABP5EUN7_9ACTN